MEAHHINKLCHLFDPHPGQRLAFDIKRNSFPNVIDNFKAFKLITKLFVFLLIIIFVGNNGLKFKLKGEFNECHRFIFVINWLVNQNGVWIEC